MVGEFYDLVIYNADIITMDSINETAEMLGITEDKFTYVGRYNPKVLEKSKRSLDIKGKSILPGFIDLHTHLWKESSSIYLDLRNSRSYEEAIETLKEEVKSRNPGEWIFANNWDESKWARKEFLKQEDLDTISPKNPLYTHREDGHLCIANSLALKEIIDKNNLDSHPGVVKDATGKPIGVLKDVWLDLTPFYKERIPDSIVKSTHIAASKGITSVIDNLTIMPEGQKNVMEAYFKLDMDGKLPIRVFLNPTYELMKEHTKLGIKRNAGSLKLRYFGYKGFFDGALGAHTALLSSPYQDADGNGDQFFNEEELISQVVFAEKNDLTLCIHAIGDLAIEKLLNCYEEGIKKAGKNTSIHQHRIEHAEMINDNQIQRAKKLGILLSMQPNFLKWEHPGELYESRLGKARFRKLNRFAKILENDVILNFGSDNMPLSPFFGIKEASTFPSSEIKIPVFEAIRAYTINNAQALFMDQELGSISEGKYADFIILSQSPLDIDPSILDDDIIENTFVGGEEVYNSSS